LVYVTFFIAIVHQPDLTKRLIQLCNARKPDRVYAEPVLWNIISPHGFLYGIHSEKFPVYRIIVTSEPKNNPFLLAL